jgi:glycosyltransferase involved in cell wall biosynthesis
VLIASLKKGESSDSYTDSLLRTASDHLVLNLPANPNTLSEQRNRAAQYAVDHGEDLLFVDSDMGWPSDAIDRLVATGLPVVGALCFGLIQGPPDGCGGYETTPYPTLFDWRDGYEIRWDYPRGQVVRVAGTGAAFLLIHHDVLAKVGPGWFDRLEVHGDLLGEDLSFCHRLYELDIAVHVHTGVRTTHYKPVWVGEDYYIGSRLQRAVVRRRDALPVG